VTVGEGAIGGFASQAVHFPASEGLFDTGLEVRPLVLYQLSRKLLKTV